MRIGNRRCYNLKLSGQGRSLRKFLLSEDFKGRRDLAVQLSWGRSF